ncbi:MAG: universal stress protein [Halobacteriales archaeon]|nr:universal stress protein [Halobacteriales archaeon]
MYDQVLIPTDGSEGTKRAVGHGLGIADTFGAAVHVVYVIDVRPYGGIDLAEEAALERAARRAGRRAITSIRERAEDLGLDVTHQIAVGVPHAEIVDSVEANDIDLVTMGTHGRTGMDLAVVGSTTERVLRGVETPVLTTPVSDEPRADPGGGPYEEILVPTDGSEASLRAAEHAIGFADRHGGAVHALYVVDTTVFEYDDAPRSLLGPLREGGETAVARIESLAAEAAVPVSSSVDEGTPSRLILGYAAEIDADLLVLGRRGRTGLPEVLLGSTTARVVRSADAPVLSVT